ncbi:MAG: single-stranded DNA-binding protein [candidate division Zixibacteria bacterium]|nr:single-stranded DNA-binding protein [candidate division Zixibacteria bacterium]
MSGLNKAILIGNLGKDPELRYTPSGQAVSTFSLATSRRWKDKEGQQKDQTDWHNLVAWGKQAEIAKEYLKKGSSIYVEGRIQYRSYDDKEGNKKYITEIVIQNFQMLGRKGSDGGSEGPVSADTQVPSTDEDIPF